MIMALKLLCRVVRRRLAGGEELEVILADYTRLTEEDRETVRAACGGEA